jgi:exopolyphosphatase/guanosine-5'-triphosphate,3'-diphosphate pyrophosphatase
MKRKSMRYAAIDIGSNTFHLLIIELSTAKKLKVIRDIQKPTRLSRGLEKRGEFELAAMQRSIETLKEFCQICNRLKVKTIRAVGTSALRRSKNSHHFLQQTQEKCQLEIKVISGFQEAELIAKAVSYFYDLSQGTTLIVDIGGGSTEFIFVKDGAVKEAKSIILGCVDLSEHFFPQEKATDAQRLALQEEVAKRLEQIPESILQPKMVSLGGTATCLGSLALGLKRFSPEKVEGMVLHIKKIDAIIGRLQELSVAKRIRELGLEPLRADIILAGSLIQRQIMKKYGITSCTISTLGVRYGLIVKMIEEDGICINNMKELFLQGDVT